MNLNEEHGEWLEARGLSVEVCAREGVHSIGPSIAFPYVRGGQTLFSKLRHPTDKSRTRCAPAGVQQDFLWRVDCLKEAPKATDVLIITEGEPDALAILGLGYQYVVSLPSGAAGTPDGCRAKASRVLTREEPGKEGTRVLLPEIAAFRRIVVATDGDMDGRLMRDAIVEIIGPDYCYLPHFPHGTKDANEVLQIFGEAAARKLIEDAKPADDDGFIDFLQASETMSYTPMLKPGIPYLEPHFKPPKTGLIIVGGQAGHGKSTIAQQLLLNIVWANTGTRASIYHGEGDKKIVADRAARFWKQKAAPLHVGEPEKHQRREWLCDTMAFMVPQQGAMPTFEWLIRSIERQALGRKRTAFLIDPWNQIVLQPPKGMNLTDYIGECIFRMKRMSEELGILLMIAHHTTKSMDPTKPPNRYDLAGSAHWVNAADHLLLAWKPREDQNCTRLEVAKSKDHDRYGVPGSVWVTIEPDIFRMNSAIPPQGFEHEVLSMDKQKMLEARAAQSNGELILHPAYASQAAPRAEETAPFVASAFDDIAETISETTS